MRTELRRGIPDYFLLQKRNIGHYLRLCVERAEAEPVHQLRVSVKKMRAVFKLVEVLLPADEPVKKRDVSSLRRLFKLAGAIRDSQVQKAMLLKLEKETNCDYHDYSKYLERLEARSIKKFHTAVEMMKDIRMSKEETVMINETLSGSAGEFIERQGKQLLSKLFKKFKKLATRNPGTPELHKMRMLLKQIRYIIAAVKKDTIAFNEYQEKINSLKKAETRLGKWHDRVVSLEILARYIRKKFDRKSAGYEQYDKLRQHFENEKNEYQHSINEILEAYFDSAPSSVNA